MLAGVKSRMQRSYDEMINMNIQEFPLSIEQVQACSIIDDI